MIAAINAQHLVAKEGDHEVAWRAVHIGTQGTVTLKPVSGARRGELLFLYRDGTWAHQKKDKKGRRKMRRGGKKSWAAYYAPVVAMVDPKLAAHFDEGQHPRDEHGRFAPDGGGGIRPEARAGSDRVRQQREVERRMDEEAQWQRLMQAPSAAVPDIVATITEADAVRTIRRLDAAPGDNPAVRRAIRARFPNLSTQFDEDQPRDERGQWTAGGGTSGASPVPASAPANRPLTASEAEARAKSPEVRQRLAAAGLHEPPIANLPDSMNTQEIRGARALLRQTPQTSTIDTPERQALRERIAKDVYSDTSAGVRQEREAWIFLGPAAAGKSSIAEPVAATKGARVLDSDMVKVRLPEYEGWNAGALHVESTNIMDTVTARAIRAGDNVMLPLVGKTPENVETIVHGLVRQGYKVHVALVSLPAEKAAGRAVARFAHTGRFVDPDYVVNAVNGNPPRTYARIKNLPGVVSHEHLDNDVPRGHPPRVVERG